MAHFMDRRFQDVLLTETCEELTPRKQELFGKMNGQDIREDYKFHKIVGSGAFATVF